MKLREQKKFGILWLSIGAALFLAGLLLGETEYGSYIGGFGGGLTAVGLVRLLRVRRLSRDPEKAADYDAMLKDERTNTVRAVPAGESFSRRESLCVLPQEAYTDWDREMQGDTLLVLTTPAMRLEIDLRDGHIVFRDAEGRLLNAEDERRFTPYSAGGEQAYSVLQTFRPDPEESFYGL